MRQAPFSASPSPRPPPTPPSARSIAPALHKGCPAFFPSFPGAPSPPANSSCLTHPRPHPTSPPAFPPASRLPSHPCPPRPPPKPARTPGRGAKWRRAPLMWQEGGPLISRPPLSTSKNRRCRKSDAHHSGEHASPANGPVFRVLDLIPELAWQRGQSGGVPERGRGNIATQMPPSP